MHLGILAIEGLGSSSHICSVVEKTREASWKLRKIGLIVSQTFTPWLEHDKIWAQCALDIPLENILEKVWWCRRFEMESGFEPFVARWVVQMKENMHELGVIRNHMLPWNVVRKGRYYY
jgi:hypothetical protein